MTRIRLQYVHEFVDRHGEPRWYLRRPGFKRVRLPVPPGSQMFMDAYKSALNGAARIEIGATRSTAGTVGALVSAYLNGIAFNNLAPETRRSRRGILERFRDEHGNKRVATLQCVHVQKMVNAKAGTIGSSKFSKHAAHVDGIRGRVRRLLRRSDARYQATEDQDGGLADMD